MRFLHLISSLCLLGIPALGGCTEQEPAVEELEVDVEAENALEMTGELNSATEFDSEFEEEVEGVDINNVGE